MKHTAKAIACTFLLLLIVLCTPNALAHPGKTDGDGGHHDRSTGEYHYHHGYPAHNHRDMDGDGDLDCPYDFDDKTDHSSGSSSGSNTHTSNSSKDKQPSSSEGEYSILTDITEFFSSPYGIFCVIAFILNLILCYIISRPSTDTDFSCLLGGIGVALYVASLPVSASLTLIFFLVLYPLWLALQKLISYLKKAFS